MPPAQLGFTGMGENLAPSVSTWEECITSHQGDTQYNFTEKENKILTGRKVMWNDVQPNRTKSVMFLYLSLFNIEQCVEY